MQCSEVTIPVPPLQVYFAAQHSRIVYDHCPYRWDLANHSENR